MMKGKSFLRFSFKKVVAVGLSCMMFLQCSNLSFAGENDKIKTYEDANVRICSGLEDLGYVEAKYDKNSKILVQRIFDPNTHKLISEQTFDLNKNFNEKTKASQTNLGLSRYTWCGYNFWEDTDPKINMIYCEIHGGNNKGVMLDMGSREAIKNAYEFADVVEDIANSEAIITMTIGLGILAAILFPGGTVAREITKEALEAVGVPAALVTTVMNYHKQIVKADGIFSLI